MGFVPEWLRGAHPQEPSPAPLLNPKSPRHSGEATATPNPRRASLQATAPLTGDAEAVLVAGLLEGKEPPEEPSEGQEGQEGTSSRRGHPADGRVGSPVAAHDVGVQVDVLEADGRPPHHQAAAHLPVQAMHGPWAGRKHSPGTFLPNPGAPGALPAACPRTFGQALPPVAVVGGLAVAAEAGGVVGAEGVRGAAPVVPGARLLAARAVGEHWGQAGGSLGTWGRSRPQAPCLAHAARRVATSSPRAPGFGSRSVPKEQTQPVPAQDKTNPQRTDPFFRNRPTTSRPRLGLHHGISPSVLKCTSSSTPTPCCPEL